MKFPPYERHEDLPGVGRTVADDLRRMGYRTPAELKGSDPQHLYEQLEELDGPTDRCMLYTFRCIVHAVGTEAPDRDTLQWWKWKDAK